MVKILAGEVDWDEGEIVVDGEPWSSDIGSSRVAVVHQEPQLFPNLTVGENIMAGREENGWRWPKPGDAPPPRCSRSSASSTLRDRPLGELGLAVQQRTEITRALARDARVMLFDEPNSALTPDESAEFFRLIRQLADAGRVVMLISHRLTELAANSDRVAVILDGRCVRLLEGAERTPENIAETLVRGLGASPQAEAPMPPSAPTRTRHRGSSSSAAPTTGARSPASTSRCRRGESRRWSGSRARARARSSARVRRPAPRAGPGRGSTGATIRPARLPAHVSYVAADRASSLF